MSDKEKELAQKIAEAFKHLPESKKERFLGYAEGVADMADRYESRKDTEAKQR